MDPLLTALLLAWIAGVTSFVGAVIARYERLREGTLKRELIHAVVAFGGGILVGAVAFALAPRGIEELSVVPMAALALAGGGAFCWLDLRLSRRGGSKAQLMAMLMDFTPEAIALGAVFVHDEKLGILLALFIAAQNLPEGFNSQRELTASGVAPGRALRSMFLVSFLGPVAAGLGFLLLQDQPAITASMMTFASGGILYLVFQDIAPMSKMRYHWTPTLGAVAGFVVGMIGEKLIH